MMLAVSATAFDQLTNYIHQSFTDDEQQQFPAAFREALKYASVEAQENGVRAPSLIVGTLLSTLAATCPSGQSQGAVAITPAAGVVGLHLLRGLPERASLTCIEPEVTLQTGAKEAFRAAEYPASRTRFLTARPLDVMGRLANEAYHLVYADVAPIEFTAVIDAAWPLLSNGGTLILADSLLDGTVSDATRRDRETEAAREADRYVSSLAADYGALVARLPLDGGLTIVTKR